MFMFLLMLVLVVTGVLPASINVNSGLQLNVELNAAPMHLDVKKKQKVAAELQASLLSTLGFEKRPKPQSPAHVPEPLKKLYDRQNSIGTGGIAKPGIHARSANTVRTFPHVESNLDNKFQSPHRFRLWFNVSEIPQNEKLKAAELSLTRIANINNSDTNRNLSRVLVYDIIRPGVKGQHSPILRLIDNKAINTRKNSTIDLDVHPAVERWIENHKDNHGLLVSVKINGKKKNEEEHQQQAQHVRLKRNVDEPDINWVTNRPMLYAYTDDGKYKMASASRIMDRHAKKTALKKHRRRKNNNNCKRHPLYVSFADVGWNDWIIAPDGYEAFYCHGDCPFPLSEHLNSTNHAIVQNFVYSTKPNLVPKACCVPTALNSISLLYSDDGDKIIMKNYQDMTVLGCGCR